MRRIFKDEKPEEDISLKGYTIIRKAANVEVCDELADFYLNFSRVDDRKFTISNWSSDTDYRHRSYLFITQRLSEISNNFLLNYKPVLGVFAAKQPDAGSDMLLHQDWSLVDESAYRSVSIWLALCDMNKMNGNLQVAEKSHLYAGFPRGVNVPVPFDDMSEEMRRNWMTDIPLAKGDAVVFDHRLIHASPANRSDKIRLAAVMALIPAEANLIHYYYNPECKNELEILKIDEEQFHLLNFFDMPNRPKHISKISNIPYQFEKIELVKP